MKQELTAERRKRFQILLEHAEETKDMTLEELRQYQITHLRAVAAKRQHATICEK